MADAFVTECFVVCCGLVYSVQRRLQLDEQDHATFRYFYVAVLQFVELLFSEFRTSRSDLRRFVTQK